MRRRIRFEYLVQDVKNTVLRISHTGRRGLPEPVVRCYRPGSGEPSCVGGDLPLVFDDHVLARTMEIKVGDALSDEIP
jgi:hypothetical protein